MQQNGAEYENLKRGSSAFPFQYALLTPGTSRYVMPFHWHMDYELVHVCEGTLPITIDNHHFQMQAGDVIIVPPGAIHGSQIPSGYYECVVFEATTLFSAASLNLTALQNFWETNGNQPIFLSATSTERPLAEQFFSCAKATGESASILSACGFLLALFGSVASGTNRNNTSKRNSNQRQMDRIKHVIVYMKKNYQNPITLSELAEVAGLNREYLCRIFRQIIGKSPIQFLIEYRIERSKKYLLSPSGNVTDAALSSGFSDLSYYIRKFTELNGVTPMQYRKREYK